MPGEQTKRENVGSLVYAKSRGNWTDFSPGRPAIGTTGPGGAMGDRCPPADELDLLASRSARFPNRRGSDRDTRRSSYRSPLEDALRRVEMLANAAVENPRSFSCLLQAERELYDLRPKLLNHLSACAGEWSDVIEAEAANRSHLVTWLERQFRHRMDHLALLDRLFAEIRAAELDMKADLPSLAARLKHWIHDERRLCASDNDWLFRLYWDDIGGEA